MVFLVYLVKYQTVNLKNRVRFPKTPKCSVRLTVRTAAFLAVNTSSILVRSTNNWEDNDWLFTRLGRERLQVRVLLLRQKLEVHQSRRVGADCKSVV
jgi:hypothetical protein